MEYVEEVETLPPRKVSTQCRSQFIRDLAEQFIESDALYWKVIKDYDGTPIDKENVKNIHSHFYQIVNREYGNKGIYVIKHNGDIYIGKEGTN